MTVSNFPFETLQINNGKLWTAFLDHLFANLDKFLCLKELSMNLDKQNVFSLISEEFLNLHHMEKLVIQISSEDGPSKLGKGDTLIFLFLHHLEKLDQ